MPTPIHRRTAMAAVLASALSMVATASHAGIAQEPGCPLHAAEATELPIFRKADDAKVIFALSLLAGVAGDGKANVAVSPSGVASVLSALELGADKAMKDAILKSLGQTAGSIDRLRAELRFLRAIGGRHGSPFVSADALYADQAIKLTSGIADLIAAETPITLELLDFSSAEAIGKVNARVDRLTRGRITSILEPGSSPSLVALNAVSFKDCWRARFDPEKTGPRPFVRLDGTTADRATMVLEDQTFAFASRRGVTGIELPYADQRFAMTLVTTATPEAPAAFLSGPRAKDIAALLAGRGLKPTEVRLTLPKFAGTGEHDLLALLARLGLGPGLQSKTQLSGFAAGLSLSALKQKTYIAIDEQGTEAAAATAAIVTRSLAVEPERPVARFDRPFVYALKHRATGTILMIGYIADPGAVSSPQR